MDVLCATQPRVVKATRPNIYDQEHTIMNNARYGRSAQRIHGPVGSLQTGHSLNDAQWFIIQFGTGLLLWPELLRLCENSQQSYFLYFSEILKAKKCQTVP